VSESMSYNWTSNLHLLFMSASDRVDSQLRRTGNIRNKKLSYRRESARRRSFTLFKVIEGN